MNVPLDPARLRRALKRYRYAALILLLGVLLMLLPVGGGSEDADAGAEPEATAADAFDLAALERQLADARSQISGVGEATVVLTLRSSGEEVLAQDTSEGSATETETVIISTGSSTEQAVSVKTIYPEFQGALVVCDGGGSASVKLEVLKAVSAITGLSSDQISICKRK